MTPSPTEPPPTDPPTKARNFGMSPGPARKFLFIGLLLVATLVAGALVSGVIEERENRQAGLLVEFTHGWGPEQTLHTPILMVPFQTAADQPLQYLKIAPSRLKANIRLSPEDRRRGLFHATVYGAATEFQGLFTLPTKATLNGLLGGTATMFWSDSVVMLETTDLSGVAPGDRFAWDGAAIPWQNCREVINKTDECQHPTVLVAHPHLTAAPAPGAEVPFQASVSLRGTTAFHLLFQGRELDATASAPWPTPSFSGTLLPSSSTVTAQGFEAQWQAVDYSTPKLWLSRHVVENVSVGTELGVNLLEATPTYRMIHRASKYNILFVILCFTAYALFEVLARVRIHVVQYGLLGISLTLFALLLVSFAEPMGYAAGYAVSAGMVLAQASLYTMSVTGRPLHALVFGAMLATLFGFLYVLLSLETYSLLMGSLALFGVLSVIMALTRRIDWSTGKRG